MNERRYEKSAACFQFDGELEAYLEGEARPSVVAHARECAFCGALLKDLQQITQMAGEMPLEEPSPTVWANVRSQLESEGVFRPQQGVWSRFLLWRPVLHPVPLGALALLMLLGGAISLPPGGTRTSYLPDAVPSAPVAAVESSTLPVGEEENLASLVEQLENNFHANEATISPDLKATYEKSLVSLNASIRECLDTLKHEPRSALTHEYLLTAYTRKAEVLSSALEFRGR